MEGTTGVKTGHAGGTARLTAKIGCHGQFVSTGTAQHRTTVTLAWRPHLGCMIGKFGMTVVARVPLPATPEPDGDDVGFSVPVPAAGLMIYIHPPDLMAPDVAIQVAVGGRTLNVLRSKRAFLCHTSNTHSPGTISHGLSKP